MNLVLLYLIPNKHMVLLLLLDEYILLLLGKCVMLLQSSHWTLMCQARRLSILVLGDVLSE